MRAIYRREMQSYFYTPTAYVYIGVFMAMSGVFFGIGNLMTRSTNLLSLLANMGYLWMLLTPLLVMRLFAGERRQHADRLLLSSPCSIGGIVLGKFFAACTVLLCGVVLTFAYPALVAVYGTLYVGETLVGYLGFILQGCAFIALDMLISCFARNQATAAILCFGGNLLVWFTDILSEAISVDFLSDALAFVSLYRRFLPFSLGQLSFASVLYHVVFTALMLFLCGRMMDARRWNEAQS